ncbi:MAG: mandelate racemase/muconate lactonizing enzyme family protein [Rhodothermales bacterium]
MKIIRVETWEERLPLTRPYTIATKTVSDVALYFARVVTDQGLVGMGSGAPTEDLTGESPEACEAALAEAGPAWLEGRDARHLGVLTRVLKRHLRATPAARAALDMALYDLMGQYLGVPLVDFLGRCHDALPTSITIGIKSTDEALTEADEYLGRGFRCLKVKLGHHLDEDLERLHKLREHVGNDVLIRVDANQGYTVEETLRFEPMIGALNLEFVEQPLPASAVAEMRQLPSSLRSRIAADESLHREEDALALARDPVACGIYNIKLMKCGGITSALAIASLADAARLKLMWGCMDESVVSIAAALHTAYACPATRYLDLDGSFDLSRDLATGGFILDNGYLRIPEAPGLGIHVEEPSSRNNR